MLIRDAAGDLPAATLGLLLDLPPLRTPWDVGRVATTPAPNISLEGDQPAVTLSTLNAEFRFPVVRHADLLRARAT